MANKQQRGTRVSLGFTGPPHNSEYIYIRLCRYVFHSRACAYTVVRLEIVWVVHVFSHLFWTSPRHAPDGDKVRALLRWQYNLRVWKVCEGDEMPMREYSSVQLVVCVCTPLYTRTHGNAYGTCLAKMFIGTCTRELPHELIETMQVTSASPPHSRAQRPGT